MLRILLTISAFALAIVGAEAATLKLMNGSVSVNRGEGFKPVTSPLTVRAGDLVMVNPDSSAQIVYNDRCSVRVMPGSVVSVASEPPCKKMASFDPDGTRMNAGITPGKGFAEPPRQHHWLPYALVGAGAVVVGLCIGDVICDDDPVSR